jgi:hexosaminidase
LIPAPREIRFGDGTVSLQGMPFSGPANVSALLAEYGLPVAGRWSIVDTHGPEGYRLNASAPELTVEGGEPGLLWAVQSLRQLVQRGEDGLGARVPEVEVVDSPDYSWRGSLLDVARWAHPVEFLYQYVDLLALHKLNRLHLHLTDDQGWRFEVKRYPRLTEVGGFRAESPAGHYRDRRWDGVPHGGFYSQDQLRALVSFASRRGVLIMPEIDLPGHTQAAIAAYPELGSGAEVAVSTTWGIHNIVVNSAPATIGFFRHVLDEVTEVFPFEYVHLGGDEVRGMPNSELGWWIGQLQDHLASRGRRTAVWDELLEADPPKGLLFFGWQDTGKAPAARRAGFEAVSCPTTHAYLDYPEAPNEIGLPVLPLSQVYAFAPGDVTGVQGNVWSEYLPSPELVLRHAFPRLAALAEIGWAKQDFAGFTARLPAHLILLRQIGANI